MLLGQGEAQIRNPEAKLILKYEVEILKEIPLTRASFTIGRVPGNDLVWPETAYVGV